MRIHEAAAASGLTPRAVRFYEEKGLLPPARRTESGYRDYGEEDVERLRLIASLRELGQPVEAIPELLAARRDRERLFALLDRARADVYAQWVDLGIRAKTFDRLVAELGAGAPGDALLHEAARELRELRDMRQWRDAWQFDALADRFDDTPLPHLPAGLVPDETYRRTLRELRQWLDPAEDEAGLDLGAGTGNLTALLAASGAKLSAVEQSAEMLRALRRKCPGVDARQGNLLALPFADGVFRFVASTFALEHLTPDQQLAALAEADRALAPGGRLAAAGVAAERPGDDAGLRPPLYPMRLDRIADWFDARGYTRIVVRIDRAVGMIVAVKAPA